MRWASDDPVVGIIEGFYGPPWTWSQRTDVARWCADRGMTHYVYAPKDDPKHRERWRDPYEPDELARFAALAADGGLELGFALSPGLDIDYSSSADRDDLWHKVASVLDHGVGSVVLALDDIPDRPGLGREHALLVSWLHDRLDGAASLVLVPTQYIGSRPTPHLAELAAGVPPDVAIAWTGESVVNDEITVADAERRAEALGGRPPLLWDNYPVNDAFMADRLFLGPLRGRDPGLPAACAGWLANPMVQPVASQLPLASVAALLRGEDPDAAWLAEAQRLGWLTFAEACDGELPQRLVAELASAPGSDAEDGPARALTAWLEAAAAVEAPGLEEEAAPWLEQVRLEAAVGLRALRLLAAARPTTQAGADGSTPDSVDADAVLGRAMRLLATWPAVRRAPVSVLGPRCSVRPALEQRADGGWRLRRDAVIEDGNALDHLARLALDAAALAGPEATVTPEGR